MKKAQRFLSLAALAVAATMLLRAPGCTPARPAAGRPNVVFWLIDTCRADRLSAYGHDAPTSPFLEELAAEGALFEQCRAQAPWTKPSMAALLTALYPEATGVRGVADRLSDAMTTLPEALQAAGYYTMGLSANPIMGGLSNYQQGFDRFWELQNRGTRVDDITPLASGSAKRLVDEAIGWVDAQTRTPFFLYLHTMDPHELYKPAPEFLRQFADPAAETQYREQWQRVVDAGERQVANHFTADRFARAGVDPHAFVEYGRRLYDGDLLASDTAMHRLWSHLRQRGLTEDTIFILTSDHGEEFFEHGGTSHGFSLYDELLHVPLVIRAPGRIVAGTRITTPVRSIDIYPTLLDLLGLPIPAGLDGHSLRGLLAGHPAPGAARIYAEKRMPNDPSRLLFPVGTGFALYESPWKFVFNPQPPVGRNLPKEELYRIDTDPGETRNVAADHPEMVADFTADLLAWAEATARRAPPRRPRVELTEATLEHLRQLGYADGPSIETVERDRACAPPPPSGS